MARFKFAAVLVVLPAQAALVRRRSKPPLVAAHHLAGEGLGIDTCCYRTRVRSEPAVDQYKSLFVGGDPMGHARKGEQYPTDCTHGTAYFFSLAGGDSAAGFVPFLLLAIKALITAAASLCPAFAANDAAVSPSVS